MAKPSEILAEMYQEFQRGDIPAILGRLAPDCRWEDWTSNTAQAAGISWMAPRRGPQEVLGFFQILGTFKFHSFDVRSIIGDDSHAIADLLVDIELPNGKRIVDEELHYFSFNRQGQVTRFRHYLDTAKAIAATKS